MFISSQEVSVSSRDSADTINENLSLSKPLLQVTAGTMCITLGNVHTLYRYQLQVIAMKQSHHCLLLFHLQQNSLKYYINYIYKLNEIGFLGL